MWFNEKDMTEAHEMIGRGNGLLFVACVQYFKYVIRLLVDQTFKLLRNYLLRNVQHT